MANPPLSTAAGCATRLHDGGPRGRGAAKPMAPPFSGVVVGLIEAVAPHPNADKLRAGRGRCRHRRPPANRLRRAQCPAAGRRCPAPWWVRSCPASRSSKAKLRGVESDGMLCSARELGSPTTTAARAAADAPVGKDVREYLRPRRHDPHPQAHAQPRRLPLDVRHRARRRGAHGRSRTPARDGAGCARDHRDRARCASRDAAACGLLRPRHPRPGPDGEDAGVDGPPAGARGPPAAISARGHHQLRDARARPAHARVRPRAARGRHRRAHGAARRGAEAAQRARPSTSRPAPHRRRARPRWRSAASWAVESMRASRRRPTESSRGGVLRARSDPGQGAPALQLASDAGYRFERGVDFAGTRAALERATELTLAICGGEAGPVTEAHGTLPARTPVRVRPARVRTLLGYDVADDAMAESFARLRCHASATATTSWSPRPAGASTSRSRRTSSRRSRACTATSTSRRCLRRTSPPCCRCRKRSCPWRPSRPGWSPATGRRSSPSASSTAALKRPSIRRGARVKVLNPIAAQLDVMRTTMLPGLIETLRANLARKASRIRIFETGRVFLAPRVPRGDRVLLAEDAAERGKPPIRGRLMRIHSHRHKVDVWLFTNVGRSPAVVPGDGGHLLSLEVGKRGIFQNLQADAEEGDAHEPDAAPGASRGGSLDDRHAIVAVPRRVGHACPAEGQPAGDVQPPRRAAGNRVAILRAGRSPASRLRNGSLTCNGTAACEPPRNKNGNGLAARTTSHHIRPFLLRLTEQQKATIQNELQAAS